MCFYTKKNQEYANDFFCVPGNNTCLVQPRAVRSVPGSDLGATACASAGLDRQQGPEPAHVLRNHLSPLPHCPGTAASPRTSPLDQPEREMP